MFTLIFMLLCLSYVKTNDDPQEIGDQIQSMEAASKPFRLEKFNFAWDKAQRRLNDEEQQRLFVDMAKLDKQALKAKHEYGSGKNPEISGAAVESIDKKFINLLKQFKLYDIIVSLEERKTPNDDSRHRRSLR